MKWDIFCRVVDNYGDIGVTWRLARQLVAEHGQAVRLWVDEMAAFAQICPGADAEAVRQVREGVELRLWTGDWRSSEPGDVVIEAFGCDLPAAYVAAMAVRPTKVLWLNLEYLSAEDWVEGCHGLPSLQSNGLQKFFFFPGFTAGSGGLLRERELLNECQAFQADAAARADFLAGLGVRQSPGARLISLFAYENAGLAGWLEALAADGSPSHLLVPEGRILGDLQTWLGMERLVAGDVRQRGQLQIQVLPFIEQAQYDRLLWCCDFNAVRGEDSFLRAQWAGRPLLWHIYQQEQGAHWDKLEAFLALYTQGLSAEAAGAVKRLWRSWNAGEGVGESWQALLPHWAALAEQADNWRREQGARIDLAAALVQFYRNWLSYAA
ncbi:elongation factor P maturation arginine rhamnosyltransferase EarP [Pseudomonas benzenivorans]|uniref:Protein-arginine rhamnosyltransferase n=1 Tax=Pseudomonas benzenivorans TaxID=556533 RepID=A0ABY5H7F5_9PSED|nr:elongation factor P maturation arginine rhamnosyltransferase EarP [Pseudomonas benzenivorans]UTW08263.1 elongation factor P maturation arginine rhamnosyltransferase EarP [Pseudomonas benzenivorans]